MSKFGFFKLKIDKTLGLKVKIYQHFGFKLKIVVVRSKCIKMLGFKINI